MPSLIRNRRLAAIPAAVALVATAGCQHQPPGAAPTPTGADSVDVGYGEQARRDLTGSVGQIETRHIQRGGANSMADLLEGRVAGLDVLRLPDGGVSLRVRGARTLLGSDEPLLVVDGTPVADSRTALRDLDPREVRSVSVLKDAGSLAAYGSRGANGVVLVTTTRP